MGSARATTIVFTIINFAIIIAIIIGIYKAIQSFKNYVNRNKEMEKKISALLGLSLQL
ncbi:hypothetical protein [Clostridium estertheticum]|uniref:hypothetical protein n=1 Tax=Clostridium estertheticum TaxID=238834 RepID=UPI000AD666D7|nr:hypothetical protein [Clostridium estertheticum]MBU3071920.1 hypothetical protein [Clostridium estertheticum]MBU3162012.1 hypothetical protein [Clostridium estertheticum]MBZ9614732.1 hypothetical protein [Clostridium estertheticum subsp. laramiense]WAG74654.1 hypothetical protein LL032_04100 [Clostridium estertheticum]